MEEILGKIQKADYELIELKDRNKVSILHTGDTTGTPIIYFHGSPGSRLEILFAEKAAKT